MSAGEAAGGPGAGGPGDEAYYEELSRWAESDAPLVVGPVRRMTDEDRAQVRAMLLDAVSDDPENAALLARVLAYEEPS